MRQRGIRPVTVQQCSPELLDSPAHLQAFWFEVARMFHCRHPRIEVVHGACMSEARAGLLPQSRQEPLRVAL